MKQSQMKTIVFVVGIITLTTLLVGGAREAAALHETGGEPTIAELQTIIAELQAKIAAIRAQLSQDTSGLQLTRTLTFGESGPEVLTLQKMLNSVPGILVASSGAGSPGSETRYFGSLTLQAVNAFQEAYRAEILDPLGLPAPTGVVGPKTRQVLNRLAGGATDGTDDTPSAYETIDVSALGTRDGFYIRNQGSNTVEPGETLTISGGGFSDSTRVVIGHSLLPASLANVESSDTIRFGVPEDAPRGLNDLTVVDGGDRSSPDSMIIVTNEGVAPPRIESITQDSSTITISGTQLTSSNIVHTTLRRLHDVPAINGVITIEKEQLDGIWGRGDEEETVVYIINDNGVSGTKSVTIEF